MKNRLQASSSEVFLLQNENALGILYRAQQDLNIRINYEYKNDNLQLL